MQYKKFKLHWDDIDANGHLSHIAYHKFTTHIRISVIKNFGINNVYNKNDKNIGSIIFYEQIYYFKEFLPMDTVYITTEISGMSKDGKFFKFIHNFYKKNGIHASFLEIIGSWIDLNTRKIINPTNEILKSMKKFPYSSDFKIINQKDTRVNKIKPKNINFIFD